MILASASPRRKELLATLIPEFKVVVPDIQEEDHLHDDPWVTAQRTAKEKALLVSMQFPNDLIIAGDTVVAKPQADPTSGWIQYAKPTDEADAIRILSELSGKMHVVVTGVCLIWPGGMSAFTDATNVSFTPMTDKEILEYVRTGEPMDKAGAYGFQGGARPFVERVEGSVSNIIGLPLEKLEEALRSVR